MGTADPTLERIVSAVHLGAAIERHTDENGEQSLRIVWPGWPNWRNDEAEAILDSQPVWTKAFKHYRFDAG